MTQATVSSQANSETLKNSLRINEIFLSIQGETSRTGLPTAFIRLTGCPLRCAYCDTAYAFHEGEKMAITDIMRNIAEYKTNYVTVTGGEPLAQKNCFDLLTHLCDEGYQVSLETSGAMDISDVDTRVKKILDLKTPASGEQDKNRWQNLEHLTNQDEIKFVICNKEDYEWSKTAVMQKHLHEHCEVLFSPSHEEQPADELANWILKDKLPVRLQIQLHKYLWGNAKGK